MCSHGDFLRWHGLGEEPKMRPLSRRSPRRRRRPRASSAASASRGGVSASSGRDGAAARDSRHGSHELCTRRRGRARAGAHATDAGQLRAPQAAAPASTPEFRGRGEPGIDAGAHAGTGAGQLRAPRAAAPPSTCELHRRRRVVMHEQGSRAATVARDAGGGAGRRCSDDARAGRSKRTLLFLSCVRGLGRTGSGRRARKPRPPWSRH